MHNREILYLSEQDVQAVLSRRDVIDTVEEIFRQAGDQSIVLGSNSFLPTGDGKTEPFYRHAGEYAEEADSWAEMDQHLRRAG